MPVVHSHGGRLPAPTHWEHAIPRPKMQDTLPQTLFQTTEVGNSQAVLVLVQCLTAYVVRVVRQLPRVGVGATESAPTSRIMSPTSTSGYSVSGVLDGNLVDIL